MNKYLHAGLSALVNTKNKANSPWFFGHSGASVLAGYFLLNDIELSGEVRTAIGNYLDETIARDPQLFELISLGNTSENISEFIGVLSECTKAHSTTGHGVIYGTLALKAITLEPSLFTKEVSDGLIALLQDCLTDIPNRHYGIKDYHSADVDYTGMKTFLSAQEAGSYSLTVHAAVYPDQIIDDTYYFLAGNLLHAVTYAHALIDLEELGYSELVSAGLEPLAQHIHLSSRVIEQLQPIEVSETYDPTEIEFWSRPLNEPHQIKLAYSGLALTRTMSDERRRVVFSDLSKYWATFQ